VESAPGRTDDLTILAVISGMPGTSSLDLRLGADYAFARKDKISLHEPTVVATISVLRVEEKTISLTVESKPNGPQKGWALEQKIAKPARGTVASVTAKGGDEYEVDITVAIDQKFETGLITFVEPGEVEIVNVALVHKGGDKVPVGVDGRALKDLLVYKETISSVDFQGIDFASPLFYDPARHLISVHGDPLRRALPIEGSKRNVSEVSLSGIGGGTVFTLDKITFGLEVCLDHGTARLFNYYNRRVAKSGDPKVQVQLIPSCGMSIRNPCTVANGLIFNVDAWHHAAQQNSVAITKLSEVEISPAPADADKYFVVAGKPKAGTLAVYEPKDVPPAEKVP